MIVQHVLDFGEIELLDVMGNDKAIVDAARVSYNSSMNQGKKKQDDYSLLRYLYRHAHTSPFEMCETKFRIKAPIFVARQWLRHRTASVNEWSLRYSQASEQYYLPEVYVIGTQDEINKQGTTKPMKMGSEWEEEIVDQLNNASHTAFSAYKDFLDNELSREQARLILPMNTYTEWVWKINLHNLLHFLQLRMDPHAQYEIRVYAETIYKLLKNHFPQTMQAFEDYTLNAVTLTALDIEVLKFLQSVHDEFLPDPYKHVDSRWTKGDIRESKQRLTALGLI